MNRSQRRASAKRRDRAMSAAQKARVAAYARQLFVWRYCENHWWRMTTGWGFRGILPEKLKDEAHNLALVMDLRWQALSITYLRDQWGREYRQFGFARTEATFKGYKRGIVPLLQECLDIAEDGLNPKHIYGRGMVFAPLGKDPHGLLPVLRLKQEQLRLTEGDFDAIHHEQLEAHSRSREIYIPSPYDLDAQIAALMEETS